MPDTRPATAEDQARVERKEMRETTLSGSTKADWHAHIDAMFALAQPGEDIPFGVLYVKPGKPTVEDIAWATKEAEEIEAALAKAVASPTLAPAPTAAEPVLGESEDCVCGHPVLTHHFTGCRLCGCSRYRIPANDLKTLQSMQAKYAAMMERMHDALHGLVYFSESVEVRMDKARAVLAAYRDMGLGK